MLAICRGRILERIDGGFARQHQPSYEQMKIWTASAIIGLALCCSTTARAVTIDWATVGNPGNSYNNNVLGSSRYGAVDYVYRISKHEVTNAQYAEFLNAVAASDTYGLYNNSMNSSLRGGIVRSGTSGSYTYSVKAPVFRNIPVVCSYTYTYDNKPVNFVSQSDAMRFINWLQNGQTNSGTENGGHSMLNAGLRAVDAKFFLPNTHEWYKAAYHKNDGVTGNYWEYPTASNEEPNNNPPAADTGNSANFLPLNGAWATRDGLFPMTDVGAYSHSPSPYGTFDQGGNLYEWVDKAFQGGECTLRGGAFADFAGRMSASRCAIGSEESSEVGFRVAAAVPEPSTLLLTVLSVIGLMTRKRP